MRANCTYARTAKVGDRQRVQVGVVAAHARNGHVRGTLTRGATVRHVLVWCKLAIPPGAPHGTNAILSRRRRCSESTTLRTWLTMKTHANHDELWQVKRRPVEVLIHTGFELRRARARLRRGHSGINSGSRYYGETVVRPRICATGEVGVVSDGGNVAATDRLGGIGCDVARA